MTADGSPIANLDDTVFAADGDLSPGGCAHADVLPFRVLEADEWIVIVEVDKVTAS